MGFFDIFEGGNVRAFRRKIKKEEKQKEKEKKYKQTLKECEFCYQPINFITMFFCPYCKKGFCENHRLPEEHNCSKPKLPYDMKKGFGIKKLSNLSEKGNSYRELN